MSSSLKGRVFDLTAKLFGLPTAFARLSIVCALIEGKRNGSELLGQVAVSQTDRSQHPGMLYRRGALARRRTGRRSTPGSSMRKFASCARH